MIEYSFYKIIHYFFDLVADKLSFSPNYSLYYSCSSPNEVIDHKCIVTMIEYSFYKIIH